MLKLKKYISLIAHVQVSHLRQDVFEFYCSSFWCATGSVWILLQFNLVCNRKWLRSSTQSVYMFGKFVGCIVFGALADRCVYWPTGACTKWLTGLSVDWKIHELVNWRVRLQWVTSVCRFENRNNSFWYMYMQVQLYAVTLVATGSGDAQCCCGR